MSSPARSPRSMLPTPASNVGDHVAINPSRRCGSCARCREGRSNLCENIFFMGSASKNPHMQGGFATYFDTTPAQCIVVPRSAALSAAPWPSRWLSACTRSRAPATLSASASRSSAADRSACLTLLAAQDRRHRQRDDDRHRRPARWPSPARLAPSETFDISAGADTLIAAAAGAPFDVVFEVTGAPPAALRSPSAPCGAAAPSCRSAICPAATFRCRPTRSWPRNSTIAAPCVSTTNSTKPSS